MRSRVCGSKRTVTPMQVAAVITCLQITVIPGLLGISGELYSDTGLVGDAGTNLDQLGIPGRWRRDTGSPGSLSGPQLRYDNESIICNSNQTEICICRGCQYNYNLSFPQCCLDSIEAHNLKQGVVVTLANFTMTQYASGGTEHRLKQALSGSLTRFCGQNTSACAFQEDSIPVFAFSDIVLFQLRPTDDTRNFAISLYVLKPRRTPSEKEAVTPTSAAVTKGSFTNHLNTESDTSTPDSPVANATSPNFTVSSSASLSYTDTSAPKTVDGIKTISPAKREVGSREEVLDAVVVMMVIIEERRHIEMALRATISSIDAYKREGNEDIKKGLPITSIVFGAIFGFIFLMICCISAKKAVTDRSKIKARIAAKREKTKQKEQGTVEDSQTLVSGYEERRMTTEYEEVHAGNTQVPKPVKIKINGAVPKVPAKTATKTFSNGTAIPPITDSSHVSVVATVHHENEKSNGLLKIPPSDEGCSTEDVGLDFIKNPVPNGNAVKEPTTCATQTNASSKESLLNNIIKEHEFLEGERSPKYEYLDKSETGEEEKHAFNRRKVFAQPSEMGYNNSEEGVSLSVDGQDEDVNIGDTSPDVSAEQSALNQLPLPPNANGSVPIGLPEKSSDSDVTKEEVPVHMMGKKLSAEDSFQESQDSTPKSSEPDIYTTAYESPVKLKTHEITQGVENPGYVKNLGSPE